MVGLGDTDLAPALLGSLDGVFELGQGPGCCSALAATGVGSGGGLPSFSETVSCVVEVRAAVPAGMLAQRLVPARRASRSS
jgi:hypothetical protein